MWPVHFFVFFFTFCFTLLKNQNYLLKKWENPALFDTFIYMQNSSPFMRDMKTASDRNQISLFSLQNIALYKATHTPKNPEKD